MTCWYTSPEEREWYLRRIIGHGCDTGEEDPTPEELEQALAAFNTAVSVLSYGTGWQVHGPGIAIDQFMATPEVSRMSLNFTPVKRLVSVNRNDVPVPSIDLAQWAVRGSDIFFSRFRSDYGGWVRRCGSSPLRDVVSVEYEFGSTVNASAIDAAIYYAQQFYVACGEGGQCELPERVLSVTREGLSYTLFDPQNYLQEGRTGVPRVDQWLVSVNRKGALRRSGVYTPTAPPGVNISVECLVAEVVTP